MSDGKRPTVLVMGASGGIGSAVVRELVVDGGPDMVVVRTAVRKPVTAESLRRRRVQATFLDLDGIERLPLDQNTVTPLDLRFRRQLDLNNG